MPSTHLSLNVHVVFSTKERCAYIEPVWRERLHAFMGGVIRQTGAVPDAVGGVADHVHLLIGLRATHCLADVVQDIKTASSKWVHREIRQHIFSWQEGYGAFTVSPSHRTRVKSYIANQEQHHRQKTYQEEYLELLTKAGVEFDPKFLW